MADILDKDINGFVREKYVRFVLTEELRSSPLLNFIPDNAAVFSVHSGKAEEYAEYFMKQIRETTGFKADYDRTFSVYSSTGVLTEVRRIGLFSLNSKIGLEEDLTDARINIRKGLELFATKIKRDSKLPPINGTPQI